MNLKNLSTNSCIVIIVITIVTAFFRYIWLSQHQSTAHSSQAKVSKRKNVFWLQTSGFIGFIVL